MIKHAQDQFQIWIKIVQLGTTALRSLQRDVPVITCTSIVRCHYTLQFPVQRYTELLYSVTACISGIFDRRNIFGVLSTQFYLLCPALGFGVGTSASGYGIHGIPCSSVTSQADLSCGCTRIGDSCLPANSRCVGPNGETKDTSGYLSQQGSCQCGFFTIYDSNNQQCVWEDEQGEPPSKYHPLSSIERSKRGRFLFNSKNYRVLRQA